MLSFEETQLINEFVQAVGENGRWNSHHGDIILDIIPSLPGWPNNRHILVVNKQKELISIPRNNEAYNNPVVLQLVQLPD